MSNPGTVIEMEASRGHQPPTTSGLWDAASPGANMEADGSEVSRMSTKSRGRMIDVEARKSIRNLEEQHQNDLDAVTEEQLEVIERLKVISALIDQHKGMESYTLLPDTRVELSQAAMDKPIMEAKIKFLEEKKERMTAQFQRRRNYILADADDEREKLQILREEEQGIHNPPEPHVPETVKVQANQGDSWWKDLPPPPEAGNTDQNIEKFFNSFPPPPVNYSKGKQEIMPAENVASGGLVNMEVLVEALGKAINGGGKKNEQPVIIKSSVDKKLPEFEGNPGDWCTFAAAFARTTHKYKFDDGENLHRLRESLKGAAKKAVEHLMANTSNVPKIMDTLEKRFGRAELVLDYLVDKVKECKAPELSKPETVVAFGTAIDSLITNIVSFDEDEYLNNKQLVTELARKLPTFLKTSWFVWKGEHPLRKSTLKDFMEWLDPFLEGAILQMKPEVKTADKQTKKTDERRSRGPAGAVQTTAGEEPKKKACPACSRKGHNLAKCWGFPKKNVQERWEIVKEAKVCFLCLQPNHRTAECTVSTECGVEGCSKKHHELLHNNTKAKKKPDAQKSEETSTQDDPADSEDEKEEAPEKKKSGTVGVTVLHGADGPLAIVPVKLLGPAGVKKTYALLDTGASHTLMEKSLADELGLEGNHLDYLYYGAGGNPIRNEDSVEVSCEISGDFKGAPYFHLKKAYTIPKTGIPPYSINVDELKKKWKHLRKAKGATLVKAEPKLIIGNDHAKLITAREVLESRGDTPIATRCKLGWVVSGRILGSSKSGASYSITGVCNSDEILHNMVKDFFSTENFGVSHNVRKPSSIQDQRAEKILNDTAKRTGNVWEVGLLWSEDNVTFPESRSEAFQRLKGMERRMGKDPEFAEAYKRKFTEYMEKGYIAKLSDEDNLDGGRSYYIPHFSVYNPNKPGKVRLVFDAAARAKGVSLNDKLLKGPDLIRPLISVLMNFRRHLYVISGDITDMFHRVKVIEAGQDAQRFLWRDGDTTRPPDVYRMLVLIFGSTASPSSAIYTKNQNSEEYREQFPEAVKAIQEDFYVDDCLSGGQNIEQVIALRQQITDICQKGNFDVGKWISNSTEIVESIPVELRAQGTKQFEEKSLLPAERVLGMWWDPTTDTFSFVCKYNKVSPEILEGKRPTKRELCRLVMSIYDPIGFVSHFKIQGIILLQATWRTGMGWDDEVSDSINEAWQMWLQNLTEIVNVKVPRCYCTWLHEAESVELHVFVDASEEAFSAVCYLRCEMGSEVEVSYVAAKSRVAPLRKISVPRLELQAAVLGVRLAAMVNEDGKLAVTRRVFWSDSQTVLSWIRSESGRFKEFVGNRIGEIHENSNVHEWRWIPTELNVADLATRVNVVAEFDPSSIWYTGPLFLQISEDKWPVERKKKQPDNDDEELKMGIVASVSLLATSSCAPKVNRFSSYLRLVRATAAVKVAAKFWIAKSKKINATAPWEIRADGWRSSLTQTELDEAELELIKETQREVYQEDRRKLESGLSLDKKSKLWKLSPFLDDEGIIRVRGRIGTADVDANVKQPIILSAKHPFTDLLIDREHVANAHTGQNTVLNNLRQRFWIVDGRQAVKRSWTRCWKCKLGKVVPLIPEMGVLPHYRLAKGQPPFTFTGTDYFGPFEVTVGRRHEKRWVALFTCMVTRAVHMEVVHNMSTDETLMALCRFIDTRGRPRYIHSDNGTNYVGAANELKSELKKMDWDAIQSDGRFYGIKWFFIPPASPHMGGAWERLVGAVKKVMTRTLREKHPKDTTFLTVVKAAESIVNDRPLTYVSSDPNDAESLTPNHFIRGGANYGPSFPAVLDPRDAFLRVQWKKAQIWTNELWDRWTKEYLPSLLTRDKWHQPNEPLQIGDVVIVVDNQQPRNLWKKGIIVKTFTGSDDQVRVVEIETVDAASGRKTTYRRAVCKICPVGLRVGFGTTEVVSKSGTGMSGRG